MTGLHFSLTAGAERIGWWSGEVPISARLPVMLREA